MPMIIPDDVRAKAEIYTGDAAGQEKARLMLTETELPSGLLPLKDIMECGYVEETGFVWVKQKKKVDHYFAKAGRYVSYAAEMSAIAEKGRVKKITGVKAKEMLIWITLNEICVDDPPTGKIHCKAMGGFSRSFPVEAFEADAALPVPVMARLKKKTADINIQTPNFDGVVQLPPCEDAIQPSTDVVTWPCPILSTEKVAKKGTTDDRKVKKEEEAVDEIGQKMKEMNREAPVQPQAETTNKG